MLSPRKPRSRQRCDGVPDPAERQRILAAEIEIPLLAAGGEARDGHRLDQRERIVLHQHAILEGAGLGLVGVADQVARQRRRARALPLHAGGEGGAAAPHELGLDDLLDHRRGAHLEGAAQGMEAAGGAVVVEAHGVHPADAGEQLQSRLPHLRHGDREVRLRHRRARHGGEDVAAGGRSQISISRRAAGRHHERRRRPLAEAQAGAAVPGGVAVPALAGGAEHRLDLRAERLGAARPAGDVVADVHGDRRMRPGLEQGVEIGDAERLGGGDLQPEAGVVERPRADPPLAILDGVEDRDQILPAVAVRGKSGETEIDGLHLLRVGYVGREVQIHYFVRRVSSV